VFRCVAVYCFSPFDCVSVIHHLILCVFQDVQIDVCAVLNDTTGTLMSCAWKNFNCKIGIIVGM
jgi:hexokinase